MITAADRGLFRFYSWDWIAKNLTTSTSSSSHGM